MFLLLTAVAAAAPKLGVSVTGGVSANDALLLAPPKNVEPFLPVAAGYEVVVDAAAVVYARDVDSGYLALFAGVGYAASENGLLVHAGFHGPGWIGHSHVLFDPGVALQASWSLSRNASRYLLVDQLLFGFSVDEGLEVVAGPKFGFGLAHDPGYVTYTDGVDRPNRFTSMVGFDIRFEQVF